MITLVEKVVLFPFMMESTELSFGITYCINNEIYAIAVHLNSEL